MSSEATNFSDLARSKLHLSVGSKDRCSLHRWVLLKNSILRSTPTSPTTSTSFPPHPRPSSLDPDDTEEVNSDEDIDSFMFPDAGKFGPTTGDHTSETQWLDSLLETLGDDEEELSPDSITLPVDDDEDALLSPLPSPMSSSDDLINQTYYPPVSYSTPFASTYPRPLVPSFSFNSTFDSPITSIPHPYDNPLPYYDQDDESVPDAIEDTSDDESETPPTPSLGGSNSSISFSEATSAPERSRLRHIHHPHVYVDSDNSYFYPFEVDPLPFPRDHSPYNSYQPEC